MSQKRLRPVVIAGLGSNHAMGRVQFLFMTGLMKMSLNRLSPKAVLVHAPDACYFPWRRAIKAASFPIRRFEDLTDLWRQLREWLTQQEIRNLQTYFDNEGGTFHTRPNVASHISGAVRGGGSNKWV